MKGDVELTARTIAATKRICEYLADLSEKLGAIRMEDDDRAVEAMLEFHHRGVLGGLIDIVAEFDEVPDDFEKIYELRRELSERFAEETTPGSTT